jgi:two-component system phosphate regulon sensor histidine kinase PhoR
MATETTAGTLIEGLPLPVVVVARDARVIEANPLAVALFGEAILGRHHGLTFRSPDLLAAIEAALSKGQSAKVRHVQTGSAQDSVYEITVSATPQGVVCAFEDRSAWEQMDQMRRDFVANVSHELRTPLTALLGFIETLRGAARNDAVARERFLAIMAGEAERMNRLVRDLLHLSRVEAANHIASYLSGDREATIIADWPDDIAYFCALLVTGPAEIVTLHDLHFELINAAGFSSAATSRVPHNALHDARALRHFYLGE